MSNISENDRSQLWAAANAAADAARPVTLKHFRTQGLSAENKLEGGFDPVTVADRGAEVAMRDVLTRLRPDDAILGEEMGTTNGTSGITWVLDPIDGTRAFISGTPNWGVLVGAINESGAILGVIDQPYIGERFVGGLGEAMMHGPHGSRPLKTSQVSTLAEATIFTTFPEVGSETEGAAFHRLARQTLLTRYGMDCYAYALVAMGQIELVVEAGLHSYDIVGPMAVVQAAGGIVTTWDGGPAHEGGRIVAAANAEIHRAALAVLAET